MNCRHYISVEPVEQCIDLQVGERAAVVESPKRIQLIRGRDGKSAYDIAVEHGFTGTERDWLDKITGDTTDKVDLDKLSGMLDDVFVPRNDALTNIELEAMLK